MKKIQITKVGNKLLIIAISAVLMIVSTRFDNILYALNDNAIESQVTEYVSEDKQSSTVQVVLTEREQQLIQSVTLPNTKVITKENLKQDNQGRYIVDYLANKNGNYEFAVNYEIKDVETTTSISKQKIISYTVSTIEAAAQTLFITANELIISNDEVFDLLTDIVVVDENNQPVTSIEIINDGGALSKVAGTYSVQYRVTHPNTKEDFDFTRTVVINESSIGSGNDLQKPGISLGDTKNYDESLVGIGLFNNSDTLLNPADFTIGTVEHDTFNMRLSFAPGETGEDRTIEAIVPKGFEITKELENSDIASVIDITYEKLADGSTHATFLFKDSVMIAFSFDINIRQDKKYLYSESFGGPKSYEFIAKGHTKAGVNDQDSIIITTKESAIKEVEVPEFKYFPISSGKGVKIIPGNILSFSNKGEYGRGTAAIAIIKHAFSSNEGAIIKIPRTMTFENGNTYEMQFGLVELSSGGKKEYVTPTTEGNYIIIDLLNNDFFKYAYDNVEVIINRTALTAGRYELYEDTLTPWRTDNQIQVSTNGVDFKDFGYVERPVVQPTNKVNKFSSNHFKGFNETKMAVKADGVYVHNVLSLNNIPFVEWAKNIESTYKFPYELEVTSFNVRIENYDIMKKMLEDKTISFELITNERTISVNHTNPTEFNKFIDMSLLNSSEYIKEIKVRGRSASLIAIDFAFIARTTDINGQAIVDGTEVAVVSTINDFNNPIYTETSNIELRTIMPRGVIIVPNDLSDENIPISKGVYNFANFELEYLLRMATPTETNPVVIELFGDEALSLINSIDMYETGLYGHIIFDSNQRNNVKVDINSLRLEDKEYITSLKLVFTEVFGFPGNNITEDYGDLDVQLIGYNLLLSTKDPEATLKNDGTSIVNRNFDIIAEVTFNGNTQMVTSTTKTFTKVDVPIISLQEYDGAIMPDKDFLANVIVSSLGDYVLEEELVISVFDIMDPYLLSKMGAINASWTTSAHKFQYTTNLGTIYEAEFNKPIIFKQGEYIVDFSIIFPKGTVIENTNGQPSAFFEIKTRNDYMRTYPKDNKFIGDIGVDDIATIALDIQWNEDTLINIKKEQKVSNKLELEGEPHPVQANLSSTENYQGQQFTATIPSLDFYYQAFDSPSTSSFPYKFQINNPIVHFVISDGYAVDANRVTVDGYDIETTYQDKAIDLGNGKFGSLLTVKVNGDISFERAGGSKKSFLNDINIPLSVKSESDANRDSVIKEIYYDFSESKLKRKSEFADLRFKNPISKPEISSEELHKANVNPNEHTKLNLLETGIRIIGIGETGGYSRDLVGFDNEIYKAQFSIISNALYDTLDWIVYVPVPKKGKTVKQTIGSGTTVVETAPSQYSMKLNELVDISQFPSGSTITYTTDETPLFALDGTDVGNYAETVANLDDVTMIKIRIPRLASSAKIHPVIEFVVETDKEILGRQTAYTSLYFNTKQANAPDTNVFSSGAYAEAVNYNLKDYVIHGKVWEELDIPSNNHMDETDKRLKNIEVIATINVASGSLEFKANTNAAGEYKLEIPSGGEVVVSVTRPNNNGTAPAEMYDFVELGTLPTSAHIAENTVLNLNKMNLADKNAGLIGIAAIALDADSIMMKKGEMKSVVAQVFPANSPITYSQAADPTIADVDANGLITALSNGNTTATVSISDGKGGVASAEYTITVVSANAPTINYAIGAETIHIFVNGTFDPKQGVEIRDGEGGTISIDDPSVTIDFSNVDVSTIGKYLINYSVDYVDGPTRSERAVYVHGPITLTVPTDQKIKVNAAFNSLEKVVASYKKVNADGSITDTEVTPTSSFTATAAPATPQIVTITVDAAVNMGGATSSAQDSYRLLVDTLPEITTTTTNVTVKVNATLDEIKALINATASWTDHNLTVHPTEIDWSAFDGFDTSVVNNTLTADITTMDPDTMTIVGKSITVTVSSGVSINAPDTVEYVVGNPFSLLNDVVIVDGDGNTVSVDLSMFTNLPPVDGSNQMLTIGEFVTTVSYTDAYGNVGTKDITVLVHGDIVASGYEAYVLVTDDLSSFDDRQTLLSYGYYINAYNQKTQVNLDSATKAPSNNGVGKYTQTIVFNHPINNDMTTTIEGTIYKIGNSVVDHPSSKVVKVNTNVEVLDDVSAVYQTVYEDGTVDTVGAKVYSLSGDYITSAVPKVVKVKVGSTVMVGTSERQSTQSEYNIIFNGMPSITVNNTVVTTKVNSTLDEIKALFNATAGVHYGENAEVTDLTASIDWNELAAIDTSIPNKTYTFIIEVTDADGAVATQELTVNVSDEIIINMPTVNLVVGNDYDPKRDVTVFDGSGKPINIDDVTITSTVNTDEIGIYEVTYYYKDDLGNEKTSINKVHVHGQIKIEGLEASKAFIEQAEIYTPTTGVAYYMNSENVKTLVTGTYNGAVDLSVVGRSYIEFKAVHPIDGSSNLANQAIYVHGNVIIHKPTDVRVKVNTTYNTNSNVTASHKYVEQDGTIVDRETEVIGEDVSRTTPGYETGLIKAELDLSTTNRAIDEGLVKTYTETIDVAFNGLPSIDSASGISFNGQPTLEMIKTAIGATAKMERADLSIADLTGVIDFSNLNNLDLDISGVQTVVISVIDEDGYKVEKTITISITIPEPPVKPNPPMTPEPGRTCQDDGYSEDYFWSESAQACITNKPNPKPSPSPSSKPSKPSKPSNHPTTSPTPEVEKDVIITVITKDIPLSEIENGFDNDLVKEYVRVVGQDNNDLEFVIKNTTIEKAVGTYQVYVVVNGKIDMDAPINVVDDRNTNDVNAIDNDCLWHWAMLALLMIYGLYSIVVILMKRKEIKELEELNETNKREEV